GRRSWSCARMRATLRHDSGRSMTTGGDMAQGPGPAPALEQLLALLDPDRARAGERYERIRARLVYLFRSRGCMAPEALADEAFDRGARRLQEGEVTRAADVTVYFVGVAGLLALEAQRRQLNRVPLGSEPPVLPTEEAEDDLTAARRRQCLRKCLGKLR